MTVIRRADPDDVEDLTTLLGVARSKDVAERLGRTRTAGDAGNTIGAIIQTYKAKGSSLSINARGVAVTSTGALGEDERAVQELSK